LSSVKNWYDTNNLQLNLVKSKYVVLNITEDLYHIIPKYTLCVPLERDDCIKYLGVYFNHRLKFVEHIYFVNNIMRKLFYKFRVIKNILDIKTIRVIYLAILVI